MLKARKRSASKLDELLREGATGKKPAVDIDRELMSTATRLMKEKLPFKKVQDPYDVTQLYKDSGFCIMDREKEQEAVRRIAELISSKELPPSTLERKLGKKAITPKKVWKRKLKRKKKNGNAKK
ncbi:unnamed protein product [Cylicostephanus goldi]|uniref:Uncharacterized protein n=1 Tax=Cylicostephanus goldi TaxID=71465 RepID=A0A3P6UZC3_CYLGO|nr:unnamed protein product [Cylicostephanus goldi]